MGNDAQRRCRLRWEAHGSGCAAGVELCGGTPGRGSVRGDEPLGTAPTYGVEGIMHDQSAGKTADRGLARFVTSREQPDSSAEVDEVQLDTGAAGLDALPGG